jgi:hypothetical protein
LTFLTRAAYKRRSIDPSVGRFSGEKSRIRTIVWLRLSALSLEEVMRKKLLRLLRIAPLALLFASVASAQTTGTVIGVVTDASTGKAVPGALVIATSPNLQGEQTAVTDNSGNFRLPQLPPGQYRLAVQLEGYKPAERSDIQIRLDKTIRANLAMVPEAVEMEEQVVRTGSAAPVINVGSAEAGAVVTKEFVASVPVGRDFQAVAVVTPGAQTDTYGIGFAGSQSPENAYILDGLNVSDPVYGTLGSNLLTNFFEEVDVKTGSFSAEYGRATGGVMNVVTKTGSNEFHGSVFSNFTPYFLVQPDSPAFGRTNESIWGELTPGEGAYDLDLGFEVGGPIQKDKLWFYAGFAPVIQKRYVERFLRSNELTSTGALLRENGVVQQNEIEGTRRSYDYGQTEYQFAGKLTYLLNENHNVTLSTYAVPNSRDFLFNFNSSESRRLGHDDSMSYDLIGRYSGKFLEKRLIVEATGGWHYQSLADDPVTMAGVNQRTTPTIQYSGNWNLRTFEEGAPPVCDNGLLACPVANYLQGGYDFGNDYNSNRFSGRLSGSYLFDLLGSHNAKAGIDLERNYYDITKWYSGNARYGMVANDTEMFALRSYASVTGGASTNLNGEALNFIDNETSESATNSFAYYLQDSWQVGTTGVTINAGLRLETQSMESLSANVEGFTINNMWSPRLQAIWDFTGTGRGKLGASWGRFYYAIPLDMGDRAFGNEQQGSFSYDIAGCENAPTNLSPNARGARTTAFDPKLNNCPFYDFGGGETLIEQIGGVTPVDPELEGMFVDMFGAQAEYEVLPDLSVGIEWNARRQDTVIEDMSFDDGHNYYITNPGKRAPFTAQDIEGNPVTYDSKRVTSDDPFTGTGVSVNMPVPERSYDGVTLKVMKNFSNNWLAQASYTYSQLRGNYAGVFRVEDGQLDPGITSEYDLATLMANRSGFLPGDAPHQLKLFGAYTWNFGPRMNLTASGAYTGTSGTPVNALGRHPLYGNGQAFIVQRGMAGRTPFVNRVDLGGRFAYTITPPYAINLSLDVFNVLNSEEIVNIDENYTFDAVQPIVGAQCSNKDAASSSNPAGALAADCPQIGYLRTTDGRPVTVNPNFGKAEAVSTAYQTPLYFRVGVGLSF